MNKAMNVIVKKESVEKTDEKELKEMKKGLLISKSALKSGQQILNDILNDSETKAKYVQIITNILEQHSKEILIKGLADIIIQGLLNSNTVVDAIKRISQTEIQSYINNQNNNEWN